MKHPSRVLNARNKSRPELLFSFLKQITFSAFNLSGIRPLKFFQDFNYWLKGLRAVGGVFGAEGLDEGAELGEGLGGQDLAILPARGHVSGRA